jgi:hypothetical protein
MATIILILAATGTLTFAGLALLVIVSAGIHSGDRHMNLSRTPMTRTEKLVRRILGTQGGDLK